jgi:hypothetical protein
MRMNIFLGLTLKNEAENHFVKRLTKGNVSLFMMKRAVFIFQ